MCCPPHGSRVLRRSGRRWREQVLLTCLGKIGDGKGLRGFPVAMETHHMREGRLQLPGIQLDVEKRRGEPVARQFFAQGRQCRTIGRQPRRQSLVITERMRHKFRQGASAQQTARHPSDKNFARTGDDRQAAPERLARRRMGVDRQIVEKQIGEAIARQMFAGRQLRRKDQPRRIDTARRGMVLQIGFAKAFASRSHRTLPGALARSRIQTSKTGAVIL